MSSKNISIYAKFFWVAEKDGYKVATKKAISLIFNKLGISKFETVQQRRIAISKYLDLLFKSTVQYGPFKGLKLSPKTW
jgi:hypothetical protein